MRQADQQVQAALAALDQGDIAGARAAYATFEATWGQIEDGVRDADRGAYRAIEGAMLDVKLALKAEPVDAQAADGALRTLHDTNARFISRQQTGGGTTASTGAGAGDAERLHGLLVHIDTARAGIAHQDAAAALAALKGFQSDWPAIEGAVRTKSPAAYTATENDMAEAQALLSAQPPRLAETDALLARMRERLVPIVESGASYGVFDASIILLREGLEALLVISALAAFLKKSGNEDKQRWIWAGAAMGAVLSVGLALALQQTFSRAGAALGSEIVEGITGLAAAGMLFYVSYWLHSKARLGAWQHYIREKSTAALARGSVLSLGLITLLAVFREGAETSVFYLGIAPSIALGDLALGIALGTLALIAAGFVILALGRRLPLRPFFLASSALIYYLGFKFVGAGLHALQVAGVLPATPAPMPSSDLLGVYPTWETMLPQVALLAIAAAIVWLSTRYQARQAPPTAA